MRDPRINLRNRELAAILAFLIPGGGHFYQGRRLKAGIFFSGIVSLFFAGMILGDWQPVYSQVASMEVPGSMQLLASDDRGKVRTNFSIGYAAQALVGLPALPSLVQQARFKSDPGVLRSLETPLDSDFVGVFREAGHFVSVSGNLKLTQGAGGVVEGTFQGVSKDGAAVEARLSGGLSLGQKVFGSPRRDLIFSSSDAMPVENIAATELRGSVTRPFSDWYQAPRDSGELNRLHGKLSRTFEIACVFTWIAGLLNLMAIWDAYDGPAYGYGDEKPEDEEDDADSGSEPKNTTKKV